MTFIEILVASTVLLAILGLLAGFLVYGQSWSSGVSTHASLQQDTRKALVSFYGELSEGMEVLWPQPGTTLPFALIRDRVSLVRWFVQHPNPDGTFSLWRYVGDPTVPRERRRERIVSNVRKLTFTSRSEGALQVNLTVVDGKTEYSILTTVRLHNLASAEALW